jgi:hypothetical protein
VSRESGPGVGERIVNFCIGALVCAICLTLALDMLQSLWPWLVVAAVVAGPVAFFTWRNRRW